MIDSSPQFKRRTVREYFPSPLNPWSFVRALVPLRQTLDDPLVVYQIRRSQRTGRNPWMLLVLAYVTVIGEILYLGGLLMFGEPERMSDVLGPMTGTAVTILVLGAIYGHWRLMLAIFSRAARVVTERRQRGDWELIAITPMPKARWFRAQLIGMGWQIWPLVRNLILIQAVLMLIFFAALAYEKQQSGWNGYDYQDSYQELPLPVYTLLILPILVAVVLEPILTTGVLAAISFYVSTLSKHPAMAMLYNFLGTFLVRSLITASFFYSGMCSLAFFFSLTGDADFGNLNGADLPGFLLYTCIATPIVSFFVEWLPAIGPLMIAQEARLSEHLLLYLAIMTSGIITYIVVPLLLIRTLAARTVSRLQQRER